MLGLVWKNKQTNKSFLKSKRKHFFFLLQGLLKELRILKDKVEHLEDQKLQYEKKLKATKVKESSGLCAVWTLHYTITAQIPPLTVHSAFLKVVQSDVPAS